MRDSKAEEGEKRSVDFGVLDLKGLPANAWVLRFIDIVRAESVVRRAKSRVMDLEREERVEYEEEERKRASISVFFFSPFLSRLMMSERERTNDDSDESGPHTCQAMLCICNWSRACYAQLSGYF